LKCCLRRHSSGFLLRPAATDSCNFTANHGAGNELGGVFREAGNLRHQIGWFQLQCLDRALLEQRHWIAADTGDDLNRHITILRLSIRPPASLLKRGGLFFRRTEALFPDRNVEISMKHGDIVQVLAKVRIGSSEPIGHDQRGAAG
jgi:hypothetical protein